MIARVDPHVDLADQETATSATGVPFTARNRPPSRRQQDRRAAQAQEVVPGAQRESGLASVGVRGASTGCDAGERAFTAGSSILEPMSTKDQLYAELKPDIQAVAEPLFEFSTECLRKRGNFLPHGAVLTEEGEVQLVGAIPDSGLDLVNSTEVLPVLHAGLRQRARGTTLRALGVAENVTITLEGGTSTTAVKVLLEHKRGLTAALYLPFRKRFLRGYTFGDTFAVEATPEVNAWVGGAPPPGS